MPPAAKRKRGQGRSRIKTEEKPNEEIKSEGNIDLLRIYVVSKIPVECDACCKCFLFFLLSCHLILMLDVSRVHNSHNLSVVVQQRL